MEYFPSKIHSNAGEYATNYFDLLSQASKTVDRAALAAAGELLTTVSHAAALSTLAGTAGSAAVANHLAAIA